MKYQCPYCESFDVKRDEEGKMTCFTCFNIYSSDMIMTDSNTPPPFPERLERRKERRRSVVSRERVQSPKFIKGVT